MAPLGSDRPRPLPPSGRQLELTHGEQRAVVVEVGGGLREYELAGQAVLDGYAESERCRSGRGQILLPWPNRLRDGRYEWAGERQQLPLSEAARGNAIHGLVRWANWTVAERSQAHATMAYVLHPQDGYPFMLDLRVAYSLGEDGLTVQTTATNVGAEACPYGVGAHPYLTVGAETIDDCVLRAPAGRRLLADERAIPVGSEAVDGTEYDFRTPRRIGAQQLDTAFADLQRDPDGLARVTLASVTSETAQLPRSLTLWLDGAYSHLMLFTGDTLPDTNRRRRSLAVEPMTCAPNAFQSGDGLRRLEPGESFTSHWGIECA
ncbi:MAG TPA: aldose 1-epimerase family protein [Solirubrobacteraceae bacterium]